MRRDAAVVALPSRMEGLPLALLKAMGAGLPVVATRVSGSQEAIEDGVNGCLVAPGDPAALARTRARILLAAEYATENRADEAAREAGLAMVLRPGELQLAQRL